VQQADVLMEAVRRIAGEGQYVTLPQVQAEAGAHAAIRSPQRVMSLMEDLEGRQLVRLIARHPVPKWLVEPCQENQGR
jgi:hypothetical protein